MQIVIEIPNNEYTRIVSDPYYKKIYGKSICKIIKNGKVLPKGHGRLVDMSEVIVKLMQYCDGEKTIGQCLDEVHTVIEADGGDAK